MKDTKIRDKEIEVILGQWQTCVEMANSVSQRRDTMNNIYITVNLAILASIAVSNNLKNTLIVIVGIVTCIMWKRSIKNYKILNEVKFKVINNIELNLPVQPFNQEWNSLKVNKKYQDSTRIEKVMPYLFIAMYSLLIVIPIYDKFKERIII